MQKTAKNGAALEVQQVQPGEDITPHVEVMTVEKRIKQEIARFDFPKQEILKIKKKYAGLSISGIDDKKGYEAVDTARKDLKKKRAAVENKREEVKADYLEMGRGIDNYAKDLKNLLTEGDGGVADLEAKLKVIDDQLAEAKLRIEQAEAKKLQDRVDTLEAAGLRFDGRFYSLADITCDIMTIKGLPDEAYDLLLNNVKTKKAELDKIEADRLAAEQKEREEFQRQKEENDRKAKELQDRENALLEKEKKAIEERTLGRGRFIAGMGFGYDPAGFWRFQTPSGSIEVSYDDIVSDNEQQWQTRSEATQKQLREIQSREESRLKAEKQKQDAAEALKNRTAVRFAKVEGLGFVYHDDVDLFIYVGQKGTFSREAHFIREAKDEDFAGMLENFKTLIAEFKEGEARQAEADRKAAEEQRKETLSEADHILEYVLQFRDHKPIICKTSAGQKIINDFDEALANLINKVNAEVSNLTK